MAGCPLLMDGGLVAVVGVAGGVGWRSFFVIGTHVAWACQAPMSHATFAARMETRVRRENGGES